MYKTFCICGRFLFFMKNIILKHILTESILWTIIILILCSTPGQYIPSTNWLELLNFDKIVHASIFFILTNLWLIYLYTSLKLNLKNIIVTVILCILYGGLLEFFQSSLFYNRSGDWLDFFANTFGCFTGLFFFTTIKNKSNIS